jgi:hypothetical protein
MTYSAQREKRRKHRRYRMYQNALVVVNPGGICSNKIFNISTGGMAFYYQSGIHKYVPNGTLDLLIPDFINFFRLRGARFSTVYNQPIPYNAYHGGRTMRLQGVRFERLTGEQHAQIINVLKYHTTVADGRSHANG